jgi:hypothetical protein
MRNIGPRAMTLGAMLLMVSKAGLRRDLLFAPEEPLPQNGAQWRKWLLSLPSTLLPRCSH